jgi:hypothetical protein
MEARVELLDILSPAKGHVDDDGLQEEHGCKEIRSVGLESKRARKTWMMAAVG